MKRVLLTTIAILVLSATAMAGSFSPNYYTKKGEFNLKGGVEFVSGDDVALMQGIFTTTPAILKYGLDNELMLSVKIEPRSFGSSPYNDGNPQFGLEYLFHSKGNVAVSLFGKYGFGMTSAEGNDFDKRYSRNDFTFGARVFGFEDTFSWSALLGMYYAVPHNDDIKVRGRVDLLLNTDLMVKLDESWGLKGMLDLRFYGKQKVENITYDSKQQIVLTLGAEYGLKSNIDVMPYLAYQFKDGDNFGRTLSLGGAIGFRF